MNDLKIDGSAIADKILSTVKSKVDACIQKGMQSPILTVVETTSDDARDNSFFKQIRKAADRAGIRLVRIPITPKEQYPGDGVLFLNSAKLDINDETKKLQYRQDVDCASMFAQYIFHNSKTTAIWPVVARAVHSIMRNEERTPGSHVVIIGRSTTASAIARALIISNYTVTMCHTSTPKDILSRECQNADVIVSTANTPHIITSDMVTPQALCINVSTIIQNGKFLSSFDPEVEKICRHTGATNGVGPVTAACLMLYTFISYAEANHIHSNSLQSFKE